VADNVGNHPNAFFNSSLQHLKELKKKDKSQTPNSSTAQIVSDEPSNITMKADE